MKRHPAWLAVGLLIFVVLACNLGKRAANENKTENENKNANVAVAEDLGSGTHIEEIHMAKDNGRGQPGDEADSFSPADRKIHCVTKLKKIAKGTDMRFSWWIVDADGTQNQKIRDIEYTTGTFENIVHAHLSLPRDWPPGKYKVQVYVNGDLDKTAHYTIQ